MPPDQPTPSPLLPGLPPALADRRGARVLLVEDDEINQEVALELLAQAGLAADIAENGQVALDRLARQPYDLVLMDLQMPVLDGFDTSAAMRRLPQGQMLPIIAMSANTLNNEQARCLDLGMNDFLVKPIDPDLFWTVLIRWLPARPQGDRSVSTPAPDPVGEGDDLAVPGLDVRDALRRLLGNRALYLELLDSFATRQADLPARIRAALDAEDRPLALRLAHTGQGLAGNIGADALRALAAGLEAAIRAGEPRPRLEPSLTELTRVHDELVRTLQDRLELSAPRPAPAPQTPSPWHDPDFERAPGYLTGRLNPPPSPAHAPEPPRESLRAFEAQGKETVLVVDDSPDNLNLINGLLRVDYTLKVANNGETALVIANATPRPDLILLDIMMPGLDGFEVCRRLKDHPATRNIPVIFLTARSAAEDEETGLALGAVDYITKPISGPTLKARVRNHLKLKASTDLLKGKNVFLIREVAQRSRELETAQDVTILAMASLAETRDNETGNHIRRTQAYVKALAQRLQHHPRFSLLLTDANIELLYKSAPLHDIGKVGIPDHILLKPGRLSPEEFEVMKTHTTLGRDAIEHAERQIGSSVPFLAFAKEIAYGHQEKWDGSGYPEGRAGNAIPIPARLMAVADVYDALISRRAYKPPMSHEKAVAIITEGRGSHFDPDIVDAFLRINDEFHAIAARFEDAEALAAS